MGHEGFEAAALVQGDPFFDGLIVVFGNRAVWKGERRSSDPFVVGSPGCIRVKVLDDRGDDAEAELCGFSSPADIFFLVSHSIVYLLRDMVNLRRPGRNARVVWMAKNRPCSENSLGVKCRVTVRLEEGKGSKPGKSGRKGRVFPGNDPFQENSIRRFNRIKCPEPEGFVFLEEAKPAVEHGMGNAEPQAELFHGRTVQEVLSNDAEDKKEAVGAVRDDEVREDGVRMAAAGTGHPGYGDPVVDGPAGDEIDQVSFIGGMARAGVGSTTTGTGFQFRAEIHHERVKQRF
jgi:hypothetical protein